MVLNDGLSTSTALACVTSAAVLAGLAFQKTIRQKLKLLNGSDETPIPKRWIRVGTVSQLIIYPVKGCAGVHVKQAKVTQLGLTDGEFLRDRVFMVVDDTGTFQVQMKYPQLALVSVKAIENDQVTLSAPDMPKLTFSVPNENSGSEKSCRIFQEKGLKGIDCGDEAASWFQKFMKNDGVRLVYHHLNKSQRTISGLQLQFPSVLQSDLATYQNYTAFLLISEKSIEELNKHVEKKVDYRSFRPSILVQDVQEPFSEIRWGMVRIGDVALRASKPCERCKITTVDPDTGITSPDGEPLKTLAKLPMDFGDEAAEKALKNRGIMGLQMGLLNNTDEGAIIKLGDPISVAVL